MEPKQILIISSITEQKIVNGTIDEKIDYFLRDPLNIDLKNEFFGVNPNYTFCLGSHETVNTFLFNLKNEINYDFIWFAECTMLSFIFTRKDLRDVLQKIIEKLKIDGIIIFTVPIGLVKRYRQSFVKYSLTLPITDLITNNKLVYNTDDYKQFYEEFTRFFNENFDLNEKKHIIYGRKVGSGSALKKYLKYKKKYLQFKNKNFNL